MPSPVIVVGHKNPDNDSICAAVGYAYLKNRLAEREAQGGEPTAVYVPARLGPLPPESAWVLERNGIPAPDGAGPRACEGFRRHDAEPHLHRP